MSNLVHFANSLISNTNNSGGNILPEVGANTALKNGLTLFFGILGAIAFLMMVIAGLKFVLSQGKPDEVAKARNTIIYAGVGLIVAASATLIVTLVLNKSS